MRPLYYAHKSYQRLRSFLSAILLKISPRFYENLYHLKRRYVLKKKRRSFVPYQENKAIQPMVNLIAFYSLRHCELAKMKVQAKLARNYGIYGFSYYVEEENSNVIVNTALHRLLEDKTIDMPFCLTWKNKASIQKNESRKYPRHNAINAVEIFRTLENYFKDERYILISGKPIFVMDLENPISNINQAINLFRLEAEKAGLPGIYLVAVQSANLFNVDKVNFDAVIDFSFRHFKQIGLSKGFYNYEKTSQEIAQCFPGANNVFRGVNLSCSLDFIEYGQWLSHAINETYYHTTESDARMVFIQNWSCFEKTLQLKKTIGSYHYFQNTYEVLKNYDKELISHFSVGMPKKKNNYAVVLHLFFEQLWPEICEYLAHLSEVGFDLYVSVTSSEVGIMVKQRFPDAYIHLVDNRGRDILPFITMLSIIEPMGYTAVCKIHSKYTLQRVSVGIQVRKMLFEGLLGSREKVNQIVTLFNDHPNLGMVVPESRVLNIKKYLFPNKPHFNSLCRLLKLDNDQHYIFPAGSMFWFRSQALARMKKIKSHFFELELGATDSKIEHAIERIFCLLVREQGYQVSKC